MTLAFDGPVAIATLNRPARLNAIDVTLARALHAAVDEAAAHAPARVLVLRGAGRAFCGGGDVHAMHDHAADLPAFIAAVIDAFHGAVLALARLRMPVVAAVHGAAAGGGFSLALAADLVFAARTARFVVAYPQLGTSSDGGLSFRLQQRLGPAGALALLTQAEALRAQAAVGLHLVHEVVEEGELEEASLAAARRLATLAPRAVAELRSLVQAPSLAGFEAHLQREREAFLRCAATADFSDRVRAFAAKATAVARPSESSHRSEP